VFGEGFLSVYVMQFLMGVGIVALVYLIGRRVYAERAGLISALLYLAYAPFTALETKILTTVTEMLLGVLYVYLLLRAEQKVHQSHAFRRLVQRLVGCFPRLPLSVQFQH
jgi:4-amino-4-deoxy-L-arabinose transferase-like glycosyltransferase